MAQQEGSEEIVGKKRKKFTITLEETDRKPIVIRDCDHCDITVRGQKNTKLCQSPKTMHASVHVIGDKKIFIQ